MGQENLPTPGLFVDDNLVNLYGTSIDQLISDLGNPITLYLPPVGSGCPNCLAGFDGSSKGIYDNTNPFPLNGQYHRPFPTNGLCPVCKGTHKIYTSNTVQYTALIKAAPKDLDYTAYGKGILPQNTYRTKTKLVAFDDIKIAEKALIDGEICTRLMDPVKKGLRDRRYAVCWWQRLDG